MGANLMGGGSSGRGRRRRNAPQSEINVTPFVDVMLVLLIVFMVTAPLLTVAVPVDLPEAAAQAVSEPEEPLVVTVTVDGTIFVQESPVAAENMVALLRAVADNNPDVRIFVRGDQAIAYGEVMQVMGLLHNGGFRRVALVTEMPQDAQ